MPPRAIPVRKRVNNSVYHPGSAAEATVSNEPAMSETAMIRCRPILSDTTLAAIKVNASGPVARDTTRLASPALTRKDRDKTGNSDWTLYNNEKVAKPAITSARENLR